MSEAKSSNIYQLDGRVPLRQAVPFGLQHVLAMFVSNITPIIILANVCGIEQGLSASLVQNAMIMAGIGTLIQLFPVWRIGARLPIVMGISFTFLSVAIFIGTTQGLGTLMGAVIVGGIVEGILGLFAKYWIKFITPVVAASVVTAIGFSLLGIGANSFAGGQGAADFGAAHNWIVGSVTLITCIVFQSFGKGYLKALSILIGLIVGYILAICMGMVDFSVFKGVGIVSLPKFMPFKPVFDLGAIISVVAIFLVSATETIGDSTALTSTVLNRDITSRELSGSIACDGFVSSISGCLGCTPITSFSQNIGLANLTKVVNRYAIGTGAIIMILGGIFPAVGVLLTTVPQAVLGGCSIMMFGSILMAGFKMIDKCYREYSHRTTIIISVALSVGLGFTAAPEMFNVFPQMVRTIFAENCVAVVFLLALILDIILPKPKEPEQGQPAASVLNGTDK